MYRKRHKRGKRLASVFLTVALITATVPVQAAELALRTVLKRFSVKGKKIRA